MNKIINIADKAALHEIRKYGSPPLELYQISRSQVVKMTNVYKVNKEICLLGSILADLKIGQAIKEGKLSDHIEMSAAASKKLLQKEGVASSKIDKVIHCIMAHHGTIPYESREAEVVANADCYRFLTIRGVIGFINNLSQNKRGNLDDIINYVEEKADEKWNIISLQEVKSELRPNYKMIKQFIKMAKEK